MAQPLLKSVSDYRRAIDGLARITHVLRRETKRMRCHKNVRYSEVYANYAPLSGPTDNLCRRTLGEPNTFCRKVFPKITGTGECPCIIYMKEELIDILKPALAEWEEYNDKFLAFCTDPSPSLTFDREYIVQPGPNDHPEEFKLKNDYNKTIYAKRTRLLRVPWKVWL